MYSLKNKHECFEKNLQSIEENWIAHKTYDKEKLFFFYELPQAFGFLTLKHEHEHYCTSPVKTASHL